MITIRDFMEVVDYRITEGSDYCWPCFRDKPYSLSAWNGEYDGWSFNITFSTEDQTVFAAEACDYRNQRAYRLINPGWRDSYFDYAKEHNPEYVNQAWDDVDYVDLETDEDWLEKAEAIVAGEDYDTRVSIPLTISDDELLLIFRAAHEKDMTFNQFVEQAVKSMLDEFKQDPEAACARYTKKKGRL